MGVSLFVISKNTEIKLNKCYIIYFQSKRIELSLDSQTNVERILYFDVLEIHFQFGPFPISQSMLEKILLVLKLFPKFP